MTKWVLRSPRVRIFRKLWMRKMRKFAICKSNLNRMKMVTIAKLRAFATHYKTRRMTSSKWYLSWSKKSTRSTSNRSRTCARTHNESRRSSSRKCCRSTRSARSCTSSTSWSVKGFKNSSSSYMLNTKRRRMKLESSAAQERKIKSSFRDRSTFMRSY